VTFSRRIRPIRAAVLVIGAVAGVACNSESTSPPIGDDNLVLTPARLTSLDSTARIIKQTNATNPELQSLVDSTLLVFTAGVTAKRIDLSTNLTSAPLYFVGIHRAVTSASGSYSTWNITGMDDPANLTSIVEVSGFAPSSGTTPPADLSGTIGGGGFVNAQLLHVAAGGVVTQYHAGTGTVSFSSGASGDACPGFTPTATITCTLETMHVHFNVSYSNGISSVTAIVPSDVDIPTMRLNYRQ
jgi:hypothetical protein